MESPAPSSVVHLSARQPVAAGSVSGLGGVIQELATKTLSEGMTQAFTAIDDDLFRRSEVNQELFEGLRELRKRQPLLTRVFLERVREDVAAAVSPAPTAPSSNPSAPVAPQALSLVEEGELEQSLAVTRMVASAETALAGEIHALRARTAVLRGGVSPEDVVIPLSPDSVANAFREALDSNASIQMAERIVVYKHFERAVMGRLGPLYHEINAKLAEAGVLPNLKPQVMIRNHADPSASSASVPANSGEGSAAASGSNPSQFMAPGSATVVLSPQEQEALREFRQVVSLQRQPGSGGQGPAASLGDLGQAILALREIHSLLGQLSSNGVAPGEVKTHLLEKLGQGTPAAKSLGEHEDAIDMVGLVFDHILKDPNLPPPMQALLARLQVPFIKVAVLEPHLFAKTDHPDLTDDPAAHERFKAASVAYDLLKDPEQRRRFDAGEIDAQGQERPQRRAWRDHAEAAGNPYARSYGFDADPDLSGVFRTCSVGGAALAASGAAPRSRAISMCAGRITAFRCRWIS